MTNVSEIPQGQHSAGDEDVDARARRRRQLIDATIESISRAGLSGTTLASVAEIARLSPGIVGFYFSGKDDLLLTTLKVITDEFEAAWRSVLESADRSPAAQIEALVDIHFDPAVFDPRWPIVWDAFWGEAPAREEYLRVYGHRDKAFHDAVVGLVRRLVDSGGYSLLDADAIGEALYFLFEGLPEGLLLDAKRYDPKQSKATCMAFLSSVFPNHFKPVGVPARPAATDEMGTTLPSWVYHHAELHDLEREMIFAKHWLLVGHVNEVPNAGDYMTLDAAGERVLVIRGHDGELRAFYNVCRHRASKVVTEDRGHCNNAIVCPYHGWNYRLDGSLRSIPSERRFRTPMDKSKLGLPAVEIDVWQGFVFIRFGGDGPTVSEIMAPYNTELQHYRLHEVQPLGEQWHYSQDANWKVILDNDNEGYHVQIGHPGLFRLVGHSYVDEPKAHGVVRSFSAITDKESQAWSERLYQKILPDAEHLPGDLKRAWLYYSIFPNLSMSFYPDQVDYFQVFPISPGRSMLRGRSFALPDDRREMRLARYLNVRINKQVGLEDDMIIDWVKDGLASSSYDAGILSEMEDGLANFHNMIRANLPVTRLREPPPPGRLAETNQRMLGDITATSRPAAKT